MPARPFSPTPTASLSAIGQTFMSGNRALAGAFSPFASAVGSLPGLNPPAVTPGAQVPQIGNLPQAATVDPATSATPAPTGFQQAKTIAGNIGRGARTVGLAAKGGALVGGPVGGLVGAGLGLAGIGANALMNHYHTDLNSVFGGPRANPGSQPATMADLAPGSAPSLLSAVNRGDYGPAPHGQHYAYSPFGSNVSLQPNSQSEFSQIAGSGPGLLGAFGFGDKGNGYNTGPNANSGTAEAAQNAATNQAKATQSKTDAKQNQSQNQNNTNSKGPNSNGSSGGNGGSGAGMGKTDKKSV